MTDKQSNQGGTLEFGDLPLMEPHFNYVNDLRDWLWQGAFTQARLENCPIIAPSKRIGRDKRVSP